MLPYKCYLVPLKCKNKTDSKNPRPGKKNRTKAWCFQQTVSFVVVKNEIC